MNQLSHMIFAFSFFIAIYTTIYAITLYLASESLQILLLYYLGGGLVLGIVASPILYYKAPNKEKSDNRTTSNAAAAGSMLFVTFFIGAMGGCVLHQWTHGIQIEGNLSIFVGSMSVLIGGLMPDWDIPFLGIERHRNIVFHSFILPVVILAPTLARLVIMVVASNLGNLANFIAPTEIYILAFFLVGYASHLALDIFPSKANPWEILWRVLSPLDEAPTGLKPFWRIRVPKKHAKAWLAGNAALLTLIALGLLGLYYYYYLVVLT